MALTLVPSWLCPCSCLWPTTGENKYLATDRDLQALTPEQKALRWQHKTSIASQPVGEGCVRCYHCSDTKGGFSIIAKGLRPSEKQNQQLNRTNLDAGAFVTKLSPMDFGFPALGWLERQLNNNYGKAVEGTSTQPHNAWVVKRGQVCVVVDIPEIVLRDAREKDRNYMKEGRNVFYIPKVVFDRFGQLVFPAENIVYAFRTTLEEPVADDANLLKERIAGALVKQHLFEVRWLLALGAPLDAAQHRELSSLLQLRQGEDESHHIQAILSEKAEEAMRKLRRHLSERDLQRLQEVSVNRAESLLLNDAWSGDKDGAVALLMEALEHSPLKSLCLPTQGIRAEGASALGMALERNSFLQTLDLRSNAIGDQGALALGRALARNRSLQTLTLNSNSIGSQGASALGQALERNSSLHSLHLGWNRVGVQGSLALGQGLAARASSLQSLALQGNDIDDQGASVLGKALETNSSLQSLELQLNRIGHEGAFALGKALERSSSLRSLYLQGNSIGNEGALALGKAIGRASSPLQSLNLRSNSIGNEGALALGKALERNSSLQCLHLGNNDIGPQGASGLGKALWRNSSLQSLDLEWNRIGSQAVSALREACRYLRELNVAFQT